MGRGAPWPSHGGPGAARGAHHGQDVEEDVDAERGAGEDEAAARVGREGEDGGDGRPGPGRVGIHTLAGRRETGCKVDGAANLGVVDAAVARGAELEDDVSRNAGEIQQDDREGADGVIVADAKGPTKVYREEKSQAKVDAAADNIR